MRRVRVAEQTLLMGDRAAELLLDYAALLAQIGRGDRVTLHAIGDGGGTVTVGLLLSSGMGMLVEQTGSALPEPDNAEAEEYLQQRLESYTWPPAGEATPAGSA